MKIPACSWRTGGLLVAVVLGILGIGAPSAVWAQKTYRCGSTYQSFPCTGTVAAGSASAATKGAAVAAKPVAAASAATASVAVTAAAPAAAPAPAPMTDAEKKAAAAKTAAAEKKAKCDKMLSELNYIIAQQKSGGSQTTMERIAGERRQSEAEFKKEGCSA